MIVDEYVMQCGRNDDVYVKSVLWIQADAIIALLRCCLINDGPVLQSYYYCFLYCLSNKTWMVNVVSSCVLSGQDRESLVSEKDVVLETN